jgi:CheY-like chemotaxis protein
MTVAESNSPARILFIEDDVDLRKSLVFILQREGYLVASAGTGRDGLRLARSTPPISCSWTCGCPTWMASPSAGN